jgi:endonuclease YncB( thermonuclease family)
VSRKPVEFANWPPELAVPHGPFRAVCRHHVDGDTYDFLVDVSFNQYAYQVIRLADIDTPETNRKESREAGLAALWFVRELMPVGSRVALHTQKDPDSFGRFIAHIQLADGRDLGQEILDAGHGVPYERT